MSTLFLGASGSLPKTSYIKMLDVWHLANMFVPFAEVLLHTVIDNVRGNIREYEAKVHKKSPSTLHPFPTLQSMPKFGLFYRSVAMAKTLTCSETSAASFANSAIWPSNENSSFYNVFIVCIFVTRVGLPCAFAAFVAAFFSVGVAVLKAE